MKINTNDYRVADSPAAMRNKLHSILDFTLRGLDTDKAKIELFWEALMDAYDEARNETIDKAVIWVDENVGSLTAIALRKHLEE